MMGNLEKIEERESDEGRITETSSPIVRGSNRPCYPKILKATIMATTTIIAISKTGSIMSSLEKYIQ